MSRNEVITVCCIETGTTHDIPIYVTGELVFLSSRQSEDYVTVMQSVRITAIFGNPIPHNRSKWEMRYGSRNTFINETPVKL